MIFETTAIVLSLTVSLNLLRIHALPIKRLPTWDLELAKEIFLAQKVITVIISSSILALIGLMSIQHKCLYWCNDAQLVLNQMGRSVIRQELCFQNG